jgi:hypothetical protein
MGKIDHLLNLVNGLILKVMLESFGVIMSDIVNGVQIGKKNLFHGLLTLY